MDIVNVDQVLKEMVNSAVTNSRKEDKIHVQIIYVRTVQHVNQTVLVDTNVFVEMVSKDAIVKIEHKEEMLIHAKIIHATMVEHV